jgi:hypothetical protein
MKFCYVDESGTGEEPFAVMVGVLVDAQRMRPTKADWDALLAELSALAGRSVAEIHTRDFYAGNGLWRGISGEQRSALVDRVLDWIAARKHSVFYTTVDKHRWHAEFSSDPRHPEVNTVWRFLGLHLVLALQKHGQSFAKQKGNTVLVFDNEERERTRFTDLVLNPPHWTDTYYTRKKKQYRLDQIVDAPYFADSQDVPLLQVADFIAFVLRRYTELENGDAERYIGERDKVRAWAQKAMNRVTSKTAIYPKTKRCSCCELFHSYAPPCLRD